MGDGTVPRPSATPVELEGEGNAIYGAERHASLQNDDDVLFQLTGILTQKSFNPKDYRDAVAKIGQSFDVEEDWYTSADPVPVRARPHDDLRGSLLIATATDAETGQERARRPLKQADDGWYEADLGPLPEGVYRISSIGANVEPVTDLVTVVDE